MILQKEKKYTLEYFRINLNLMHLASAPPVTGEGRRDLSWWSVGEVINWSYPHDLSELRYYDCFN